MAPEQDNDDDRQARLDAMLAEFRAAQQRRLVKIGKALWIRTERAESAAALFPLPLPVH